MKNKIPLTVAHSRKCSLLPVRHFSAVIAATLLSALSVQAQWNQTGVGPYSYTYGANWVGGNVTGQFTGNFFPSGASNLAIQAVTFSSNTTVSDLNFAPSIGSGYGGTAVQLQSTGGTPLTLTLDGRIRMTAIDAANGSYLNIGSTTPANALNVTLGSSSVIDVDGGTSQNGFLSLINTVTGSGSLTKTGLGSLDIVGATTISGAVNINKGAVRLLGTGGTLASNTITVGAGSVLMLLNSSTPQNGAGAAGASAARLSDTAVINLNGGWANGLTSFGHVNRAAFGITAPRFGPTYFLDFGNLVLEGATTTTAINETVGTINLQSGISRVNLRTNTTTSGNITLTAGSLTRAVGSAISFSGGYGNQQNNATMFSTIGGAQGGDPAIGQTYVKFTTAPTMTGGILPYALVAPDNISGYGNNAGGVVEFAAYDATNGIIPFSRTGSYVTNLTAPASTQNVKLSTTTTLSVAGTSTINSLTVETSSADITIGGSGSPTLKIASGAILRGNTGSAGRVVTFNTLTLDFNNQEAFIYNANGNMNISSSSALTNIGADGINFFSPALSSGVAGQRILLESSVTQNVPVRLLSGSLRLNTSLTTNLVNIASGATLALPQSPTIGGLSGEGAVRLNGQTLTVGGPTSLAGDTTFSGNIYGAELKDSAPGFAPFLTNGGNLIKSGSNSLTLSGANTYSGNTTVRQGTLIAGADSAATLLTGATKVGALTATTSDVTAKTFTGNLPNGTALGFPAGTAVGEGIFGGEGRTSVPVVYYVINNNGTTFQLAATPGGVAITPSANTTTNYQQLAPLTVDPTGNTITLPTGAGTLADDDIIYLNPAENVGIATPGGLAGSTPYYVVNSGGTSFQVSRSLGGPAIDITSTGTSVFAIQPGAFGTGTSAIVMGDASSGTAAKALLTGGAFTIERDVTVTGTGTGGTGVSTLGGNTDDNSTFSGAVSLGATAQLTSVTTGSKAVTFSGAFTGAGGLTKVGVGTVTITGDNSHAGANTVSVGTLLVNNTSGSGLGTNGVTVNGGTLGGSGSFTGDVTVNAGGTLAPGSSIESLGAGGITLTGGTFAFELNTTTSTADLLFASDATVALTLTTGVPTLTITDLGSNAALADGTKFTLISYTAAGGWNNGIFSGYADGSEFTLHGNTWKINYADLSSGSNYKSDAELFGDRFVTLTVVPEPSTWGLLALGLAVVVMLGRRRSVVG